MRAWILEQSCKLYRWGKVRLTQVKKDSHAHLEEAGESYGAHLCFTLSMGSNLVITGLVVMIHGIIPCLFTRTASMRVERMYGIMKSRIPADRLKALDADWQI